jgi:hypothetical protein
VTLSAAPASVASGSSATLNWSSTNATSCSAGGSWSGTKPPSGSASSGALTANSTFTLQCGGLRGTANASATVAVSAAGSPGGAVTGLNFPSTGSTSSDVRFRFTGAALQPLFPATYIWRVNLRQQSGYYTAFFHGPDGAMNSNSFYGAHPYPKNPPNGNTHLWEIAANFYDYTTDVNGNDNTVQYGRWHTQALVVTASGPNTVLNFYWDLPNTSKRVMTTVPAISPVAGQALSFGDAPWALGNERLSGILRGIQLYSSALPLNDIVTEANNPLSTSSGAASIWYLNLNPTPSDIADKSGKGHHPSWASSARPGLWTGP